MIELESKYLSFIEHVGVGKHDRVASSPASYISYLNSVSRILQIDISPRTVPDATTVEQLMSQLYGHRAEKTIRNFRSALRQYAAMVQDLRLR